MLAPGLTNNDPLDDDGTVFRDVIMLVLFGFVTVVVLLLPHLNPPVTPAETTPPPGNLIVEARWADDLDTDVDLWVEAPGDAPVGYSNKGGEVFNLLRDDLGARNDLGGLNYEVAFSRGLPTGEYTINLHLFRNNAGVIPIEVEVVISIKTDAQGATRVIARKTVRLEHVGEELTVLRFALDHDGAVEPGSMHNLQRPLRERARG